jgi:hypothetical protein
VCGITAIHRNYTVYNTGEATRNNAEKYYPAAVYFMAMG